MFSIRSFVSCYYFYYYHHDLQKLGANYYLVCNQFFFGYLVMTFFFCAFSLKLDTALVIGESVTFFFHFLVQNAYRKLE
jgi:hypothetical protein